MTYNEDIVNVQKVHIDHQDISCNDDLITTRFPHQSSCLKVVIQPVECIVHSNLLLLNSNGQIKLIPKVREDTEAIPDACTEEDLFLHVVNHPPKVRKVPVLNTMAEDMEEELDLWSMVELLYCVVMVLKADKLVDLFSLFSR